MLANIYEQADIPTRFQMSWTFQVCQHLWRQPRHSVENVARLLAEYPGHRFGHSIIGRELRCSQPDLPNNQLHCLTLHAHLCTEALGQFLSLPKWRCSAGNYLIYRLLGIMSKVHEEFDFVTVWMHHDADLKPKDHAGLKDLLRGFPLQCLAVVPAVYLQWWISSYTNPVRQAMAPTPQSGP